MVDDLIKFGTVQRGFLGLKYVSASELAEDEKKKAGVPLIAEGIYTTDVPTDGAAYAAGIRKGDMITKIDNVEVTNGAELQGQISRYKPTDKVPVTYVRNGKENTVIVTLKNKAGNFDIVKADAILESLGADLATLDSKKAKEYGINGGVVVKKVKEGALNDQTRMKDGFVILKINNKAISSLDELKKTIGIEKDITVSGFYPGYDGLYEYPFTLE